MSRAARIAKRTESPALTKRVAIYTRKSTEKGLDAAFTSLDAPRESVLAFIASRKEQGFVLFPERYDDGGFSGGSTERPALQRLLLDLKAGKIDVVACYKIDRISRSLADFVRIMAEIEAAGAALVSITEHFDTTSPMGRMTLNLLATFAQFEREMISERTRDKMAASRRKGHWVGGRPPYGFHLVEKRLEPHPVDAPRLQEIFALYLRLGSLRALEAELSLRGWRTRLGGAWGRSSLAELLRQPAYIGKVRYKDEVHEGLHEGIIKPAVFQRVDALLAAHAQQGGARARNKWSVLLRGLLRCGSCGQLMSHSYSARQNRRYHYYQCPSLDSKAMTRCQDARIPVATIEGFVLSQIRAIGEDPALLAATRAALEHEVTTLRPGIETELKALGREKALLKTKTRRLIDALAQDDTGSSSISREIAKADEQARALERQEDEQRKTLAALDARQEDAEQLANALQHFDAIWQELSVLEKSRIIALLIEDIRFEGTSGEIEIRYKGALSGVVIEAAS